MTRKLAAKKVLNAIRHISADKTGLMYSDSDQERWQALHQAQCILDKALFSIFHSYDQYDSSYNSR